MEEELLSGVIQDTRSQEKKNLDYQAKDLVGAVFLDWQEKDQWKKYTPREQNGSLSCVAQSGAKGMEVLGHGVYSAHPQYRRRVNFPSGGMFPQNLGELLRKDGTTTEAQDPSQRQNEATMNRDISVSTPIKIGGYVFHNHKDINAIAEAIELHKQCLLLIRCNKGEWTGIPEYKGDVVNFHHEITAVDYLLKDGKKYILIEDSTGWWSSLDKKGQRLLSAEFLQARCDNAMSLLPLPPKPALVFTRNLKIGCVGNDVKQLQIRLGIGADGLFGRITKQTVIDFQKSHQLVPDGVCGIKTLAELNK